MHPLVSKEAMARDKTKLTPAELDVFLSTHPQWKVVDGQLTRTFERPTFLDAIAFVQKVAALAEAADHHPDIDIRYRKVTLKWVTHDADGLTSKDTDLAGQCDGL
jgi:4a-hydroxytetrahydrobiopterin dehydratase